MPFLEAKFDLLLHYFVQCHHATPTMAYDQRSPFKLPPLHVLAHSYPTPHFLLMACPTPKIINTYLNTILSVQTKENTIFKNIAP